MLTADMIDDIEEVIFSSEFEETAMDYFGLHGFGCAVAVGPSSIDSNTAISVILGDDASKAIDSQYKVIGDALIAIQDGLENAISEGHLIELPYEDEEDDFDAAITSWCVGFIEGMLLDEETWFGQNEDQTAELLLPIMALSGLYETSEFKKIWDNDKLMAQFASILPDQLVDIFLFYHSQ